MTEQQPDLKNGRPIRYLGGPNLHRVHVHVRGPMKMANV